MRAKLASDRRALAFDLKLELWVVFGQLLELDQVAGPPLEAIPRGDELAALRSLAGQLARVPRIVPDPGLGELGV